MSLIDKANNLLNRWQREYRTLPLPEDYPNNVLMCIADVIDEAKEEVQKLGLDPYDDFKAITKNDEGDLIKCILDHEEFLETLTSTYLTGSRYANDEKVKILAARIMSSAMNGINANEYFKEVDEDMIDLLYRWALADKEPLTSYAVEMLSYGETLCSRYHQNNMEVVCLLLHKLREIYARAKAEYIAAHPASSSLDSAPWNEDTQDGSEPRKTLYNTDNPLLHPDLVGQRNFEEFQCQAVLHFLLSLGEYQEFLGLIMKNSILKLLLNYISITDINSPIIFDVIRYLSALLCHRKFASDFMNYEGLQLLMDLPYNQRASTGISTCFYALVFHSTVMERLCSYSRHLIAPMITTCLRLLKGKHESGRSHVILFLTYGFYYQTVIEEFDKQCGLPLFLNVLKAAVESLKNPPTNEQEVFLLRQKMKHTCNALHQYLAGQTILYAEHLRRVKDHQGVGMSPQIYTHNKALEIEDNFKTAYEYIQANAEFDSLWKPIDDVHSLGGFETFIQAFFLSETFRSTRYDASPCIIAALTFLTILPRYQLKLTEQYISLNGESHTGIKLILLAAESYGNIDLQRAALNLIVVVVCGPYRANAGNLNLSLTPILHRKTSADDVMHKMWSAIRTNNGIKVLMSLLLTKTPIVHADELRMAACKALNGLCRSRGVRQIASKLHLMSSGQLLALMREPILPENVDTHSKFCTYTRSLLEVLFGVSTERAANEPSFMNKMTKVDIVSKTPITFNKDEIYHLLHSSLLECGLKSSATALVDEVKQKLNKDIALYPKMTGPQMPSTNHLMSPLIPCRKLVIRNARSRVSSSCDSESAPALPSPTAAKPSSSKVPQKSFGVKDHLEALEARTTTQIYHPPSLNDLVHNFMRDQHMRCEHPMSIVPKFSLFREHRCPDPQPQLYEAPVNIVVRNQQKRYGVPYGGRSGRYRDYKYIFSKFKPYYTLRMDSRNAEDWEHVSYTSCLTFSDYIVAGCNTGQIKVYKMTEHPPYYCIQTTESHDCEPITALVLSQSGNMVLTASTGEADVDRPNNSCTLWGVRSPSGGDGVNSKDVLEQRHVLHGVDHASFSYLTDDKLLCTMPEHKCSIVDCYTGKTISVLSNPPGSNGYYKNHAVFNFTDDLVLNDGVLWDYRSSNAIHKFDKFNNFVSGVFSPSGIDIIINTEVWDIRTFKLLNTINSLDNCLLKYNHSKDVMYGLSHVKQEILDHEISPSYKHVMGPFESTFKTFAADSGYPSLGTYDVGKQIVDLNFCRRDRLLVTVESTNEDFTHLWSGGSVVKLYLVGRSKASREEDDEEDDEEEDDEEDDDDDSADNSEFDEDGSSSNASSNSSSSPSTSQHTSQSTSQPAIISSQTQATSSQILVTASQDHVTPSQDHVTSSQILVTSPAFTDYSLSSTEDGSMSDEGDDRSSNSSMSRDDDDDDDEEDDDVIGESQSSLNFSVMSDSDDDDTQGHIV